jgi:hypothetical protein
VRSTIEGGEHRARGLGEHAAQARFEVRGVAGRGSPRPQGSQHRPPRRYRLLDDLLPERWIFAFAPLAPAAAKVRYRKVAQQGRDDESVEQFVVPAHLDFALPAQDVDAARDAATGGCPGERPEQRSGAQGEAAGGEIGGEAREGAREYAADRCCLALRGCENMRP